VKRIVLWGLSTLSALVALLGYHTSTSSVMATTAPENAISGSLRAQAASGGGSASTPGSSTSGQSSSGASSVTGDAVATPYGPVQVQVDVTGSTITDVTVLQYPDRDGHSVQINQFALPQLINQTLDTQGSDVSMVSGATYTSQGYLQSLQSALDQAGL
jgi:uncharacterized protein with FMN-binding domain